MTSTLPELLLWITIIGQWAFLLWPWTRLLVLHLSPSNQSRNQAKGYGKRYGGFAPNPTKFKRGCVNWIRQHVSGTMVTLQHIQKHMECHSAQEIQKHKKPLRGREKQAYTIREENHTNGLMHGFPGEHHPSWKFNQVYMDVPQTDDRYPARNVRKQGSGDEHSRHSPASRCLYNDRNGGVGDQISHESPPDPLTMRKSAVSAKRRSPTPRCSTRLSLFSRGGRCEGWTQPPDRQRERCPSPLRYRRS